MPAAMVCAAFVLAIVCARELNGFLCFPFDFFRTQMLRSTHMVPAIVLVFLWRTVRSYGSRKRK